jgi:hypothetical protein
MLRRQRPTSPRSSIGAAATTDVVALAPAHPLALPSLDQIPRHYRHEINGELLYKLCAALTRKGLGSPEIWEQCRNCVAFAQFNIMNAIGAERVEESKKEPESPRPPSLFDAPADAQPAIAAASPSTVESEEDEILTEIAEDDTGDNDRDDEAA